MNADLGNEKRALRAELRQRRRTRTTTERDADAAALTATLQRFAEERQVESVALYLSAPEEPNVRPFLDWAFEHGIRVLLPITREDGLLDWAVGDGSGETEGLAGVPEVVGEVLSPLAINDVDAILAPARRSATTASGWAGAAATTTRPRVDGEPSARLCCDLRRGVPRRGPREPHDEPVDGIITPSRIITFRS